MANEAVLCSYNVYANLEAQAAYLKLNASGQYLMELQDAFADLQVCFCSSFRLTIAAASHQQ